MTPPPRRRELGVAVDGTILVLAGRPERLPRRQDEDFLKPDPADDDFPNGSDGHRRSTGAGGRRRSMTIPAPMDLTMPTSTTIFTTLFLSTIVGLGCDADDLYESNFEGNDDPDEGVERPMIGEDGGSITDTPLAGPSPAGRDGAITTMTYATRATSPPRACTNGRRRRAVSPSSTCGSPATRRPRMYGWIFPETSRSTQARLSWGRGRQPGRVCTWPRTMTTAPTNRTRSGLRQ